MALTGCLLFLRSCLLSACYCDTMSMTFRYLDSSNPNGDVYKRPSILATFSNGQDKLEQYALVDSGADMSAMDYRVAENCTWISVGRG